MKNENKLMKKSMLLSLLFLSAFIFMIASASAATQLFTNTTLNDSSKSGTHLIYINVSECAANCYIGNVTIKWVWYNGTSTNLSTVNNASGNQSVFAYSWDTTAFDDVNNGSLNFSAYNYGTPVLNATNWTSGVDIDNGNPTATVSSASFSSIIQGYNVNKGTTFTLGLDADDSIGFQSCSIYATDLQNSTVLTSTISVSGNACSNSTLKPESFLVKGRAYNLVVQATDGNDDKTNSTARRINYLSASSNTGGVSATQDSTIPGVKKISSSSVLGKIGDVGISIVNFIKSIPEFFKNLF